MLGICGCLASCLLFLLHIIWGAIKLTSTTKALIKRHFGQSGFKSLAKSLPQHCPQGTFCSSDGALVFNVVDVEESRSRHRFGMVITQALALFPHFTSFTRQQPPSLHYTNVHNSLVTPPIVPPYFVLSSFHSFTLGCGTSEASSFLNSATH